MDYAPIDRPTTVTVAGGAKFHVKGCDCIQASNNKNISKVFYVLDVKSNLMLVGSLIDRGHIVVFIAAHCFITDPNNHHYVYLKGDHHPSHRLYTMQLPESRSKILLEKPPKAKGLTARSAPTFAPIACTIFDCPDHSNISERLWHK